MKLVDIDILKNEDVCEHCKYKSTRCEYICDENGNEIETLWEMIDNLPEVDAKPVVYGHWILPNEKDIAIACICSNCGWISCVCESDVYGMPYCPNCGAKMDGAE